jgi:hypothetical protein
MSLNALLRMLGARQAMDAGQASYRVCINTPAYQLVPCLGELTRLLDYCAHWCRWCW